MLVSTHRLHAVKIFVELKFNETVVLFWTRGLQGLILFQMEKICY